MPIHALNALAAIKKSISGVNGSNSAHVSVDDSEDVPYLVIQIKGASNLFHVHPGSPDEAVLTQSVTSSSPCPSALAVKKATTPPVLSSSRTDVSKQQADSHEANVRVLNNAFVEEHVAVAMEAALASAAKGDQVAMMREVERALGYTPYTLSSSSLASSGTPLSLADTPFAQYYDFYTGPLHTCVGVDIASLTDDALELVHNGSQLSSSADTTATESHLIPNSSFSISYDHTPVPVPPATPASTTDSVTDGHAARREARKDAPRARARESRSKKGDAAEPAVSCPHGDLTAAMTDALGCVSPVLLNGQQQLVSEIVVGTRDPTYAFTVRLPVRDVERLLTRALNRPVTLTLYQVVGADLDEVCYERMHPAEAAAAGLGVDVGGICTSKLAADGTVFVPGACVEAPRVPVPAEDLCALTSDAPSLESVLVGAPAPSGSVAGGVGGRSRRGSKGHVGTGAGNTSNTSAAPSPSFGPASATSSPPLSLSSPTPRYQYFPMGHVTLDLAALTRTEAFSTTCDVRVSPHTLTLAACVATLRYLEWQDDEAAYQAFRAQCDRQGAAAHADGDVKTSADVEDNPLDLSAYTSDSILPPRPNAALLSGKQRNPSLRGTAGAGALTGLGLPQSKGKGKGAGEESVWGVDVLPGEVVSMYMAYSAAVGGAEEREGGSVAAVSGSVSGNSAISVLRSPRTGISTALPTSAASPVLQAPGAETLSPPLLSPTSSSSFLASSFTPTPSPAPLSTPYLSLGGRIIPTHTLTSLASPTAAAATAAAAPKASPTTPFHPADPATAPVLFVDTSALGTGTPLPLSAIVQRLIDNARARFFADGLSDSDDSDDTESSESASDSDGDEDVSAVSGPAARRRRQHTPTYHADRLSRLLQHYMELSGRNQPPETRIGASRADDKAVADPEQSESIAVDAEEEKQGEGSVIEEADEVLCVMRDIIDMLVPAAIAAAPEPVFSDDDGESVREPRKLADVTALLLQMPRVVDSIIRALHTSALSASSHLPFPTLTSMVTNGEDKDALSSTPTVSPLGALDALMADADVYHLCQQITHLLQPPMHNPTYAHVSLQLPHSQPVTLALSALRDLQHLALPFLSLPAQVDPVAYLYNLHYGRPWHLPLPLAADAIPPQEGGHARVCVCECGCGDALRVPVRGGQSLVIGNVSGGVSAVDAPTGSAPSSSPSAPLASWFALEAHLTSPTPAVPPAVGTAGGCGAPHGSGSGNSIAAAASGAAGYGEATHPDLLSASAATCPYPAPASLRAAHASLSYPLSTATPSLPPHAVNYSPAVVTALLSQGVAHAAALMLREDADGAGVVRAPLAVADPAYTRAVRRALARYIPARYLDDAALHNNHDADDDADIRATYLAVRAWLLRVLCGTTLTSGCERCVDLHVSQHLDAAVLAELDVERLDAALEAVRGSYNMPAEAHAVILSDDTDANGADTGDTPDPSLLPPHHPRLYYLLAEALAMHGDATSPVLREGVHARMARGLHSVADAFVTRRAVKRLLGAPPASLGATVGEVADALLSPYAYAEPADTDATPTLHGLRDATEALTIGGALPNDSPLAVVSDAAQRLLEEWRTRCVSQWGCGDTYVPAFVHPDVYTHSAGDTASVPLVSSSSSSPVLSTASSLAPSPMLLATLKAVSSSPTHALATLVTALASLPPSHTHALFFHPRNFPFTRPPQVHVAVRVTRPLLTDIQRQCAAVLTIAPQAVHNLPAHWSPPLLAPVRTAAARVDAKRLKKPAPPTAAAVPAPVVHADCLFDGSCERDVMAVLVALPGSSPVVLHSHCSAVVYPHADKHVDSSSTTGSTVNNGSSNSGLTASAVTNALTSSNTSSGAPALKDASTATGLLEASLSSRPSAVLCSSVRLFLLPDTLTRLCTHIARGATIPLFFLLARAPLASLYSAQALQQRVVQITTLGGNGSSGASAASTTLTSPAYASNAVAGTAPEREGASPHLLAAAMHTAQRNAQGDVCVSPFAHCVWGVAQLSLQALLEPGVRSVRASMDVAQTTLPSVVATVTDAVSCADAGTKAAVEGVQTDNAAAGAIPAHSLMALDTRTHVHAGVDVAEQVSFPSPSPTLSSTPLTRASLPSFMPLPPLTTPKPSSASSSSRLARTQTKTKPLSAPVPIGAGTAAGVDARDEEGEVESFDSAGTVMQVHVSCDRDLHALLQRACDNAQQQRSSGIPAGAHGVSLRTSAVSISPLDMSLAVANAVTALTTPAAVAQIAREAADIASAHPTDTVALLCSHLLAHLLAAIVRALPTHATDTLSSPALAAVVFAIRAQAQQRAGTDATPLPVPCLSTDDTALLLSFLCPSSSSFLVTIATAVLGALSRSPSVIAPTLDALSLPLPSFFAALRSALLLTLSSPPPLPSLPPTLSPRIFAHLSPLPALFAHSRTLAGDALSLFASSLPTAALHAANKRILLLHSYRNAALHCLCLFRRAHAPASAPSLALLDALLRLDVELSLAHTATAHLLLAIHSTPATQDTHASSPPPSSSPVASLPDLNTSPHTLTAFSCAAPYIKRALLFACAPSAVAVGFTDTRVLPPRADTTETDAPRVDLHSAPPATVDADADEEPFAPEATLQPWFTSRLCSTDCLIDAHTTARLRAHALSLRTLAARDAPTTPGVGARTVADGLTASALAWAGDSADHAPAPTPAAALWAAQSHATVLLALLSLHARAHTHTRACIDVLLASVHPPTSPAAAPHCDPLLLSSLAYILAHTGQHYAAEAAFALLQRTLEHSHAHIDGDACSDRYPLLALFATHSSSPLALPLPFSSSLPSLHADCAFAFTARVLCAIGLRPHALALMLTHAREQSTSSPATYRAPAVALHPTLAGMLDAAPALSAPTFLSSVHTRSGLLQAEAALLLLSSFTPLSPLDDAPFAPAHAQPRDAGHLSSAYAAIVPSLACVRTAASLLVVAADAAAAAQALHPLTTTLLREHATHTVATLERVEGGEDVDIATASASATALSSVPWSVVLCEREHVHALCATTSSSSPLHRHRLTLAQTISTLAVLLSLATPLAIHTHATTAFAPAAPFLIDIAHADSGDALHTTLRMPLQLTPGTASAAAAPLWWLAPLYRPALPTLLAHLSHTDAAHAPRHPYAAHRQALLSPHATLLALASPASSSFFLAATLLHATHSGLLAPSSALAALAPLLPFVSHTDADTHSASVSALQPSLSPLSVLVLHALLAHGHTLLAFFFAHAFAPALSSSPLPLTSLVHVYTATAAAVVGPHMHGGHTRALTHLFSVLAHSTSSTSPTTSDRGSLLQSLMVHLPPRGVLASAWALLALLRQDAQHVHALPENGADVGALENQCGKTGGVLSMQARFDCLHAHGCGGCFGDEDEDVRRCVCAAIDVGPAQTLALWAANVTGEIEVTESICEGGDVSAYEDKFLSMALADYPLDYNHEGMIHRDENDMDYEAKTAE